MPIPFCRSIREDLFQWNSQPWQERRLEHLRLCRRELGDEAEVPSLRPEDLHGAEIGIQDPVLLDPGALIEPELHLLVARARGFREDLDDEIGRALGVLAGPDAGALVGDVDEVGLDNIIVREEDIVGRREGLPQSIPAQVVRQKVGHVPGDELMLLGRRRAHEVLSVDQLMA